jgi:hypothetical protein
MATGSDAGDFPRLASRAVVLSARAWIMLQLEGYHNVLYQWM